MKIFFKRILPWLRFIAGWGAFAGVGIFIIRSWNELLASDISLSIVPLLLSWPVLFLATIITVFGWKILLGSHSNNQPLWKLAYVFSMSQLMRFIPGKIWQIAGRVSLAREKGISRSMALYSQLPETLASMSASACLGFLFAGQKTSFHYPWAGPLLLIGSLLFITIGPRFLKKLPSIPLHIMCLETGLYFMYWLIMGVAVFLTVQAIVPISWLLYLHFTGAYALAWLIGMLSVIVPNGLGVREGIFALYISQYLPLEQAALIAILFRLNTSIFELVISCTLYILNKKEVAVVEENVSTP